MGNKINASELLKDCPQGMELDCVMYEDVYLDHVDELNIIHCYIQNEGFKTNITFNQHGTPHSDVKSKCVIFPKGKTTWEGFQRPFKDGDILAMDDTVYIYNGIEELSPYPSHYVYVIADKNGLFAINTSTKKYGTRFATEEQKAKLFKTIKDNGYRWNPETKTLEKLIEPKFKVGDKIVHKQKGNPFTITEITDGCYKGGTRYAILITQQDNFKLVPNKFDINTLVPFESKVLIRNDENQGWLPAFWGYKVVDGFITTFGWCKYCIPYEGNEFLFKTNNDCDDYFKTWEK